MHIQRVYGEVIRIHVEVAEDTLERDLLTTLLKDHAVCLSLVGGFYKFKQMFLVHAGGSMYMCIHLCLA